MLYGPLLFVNHFQELAVEFVYDLIVDEELYVAADGVAESVGPGPGGADSDRLAASIQLWSQNVRKHDDQSSPRYELPTDRQRGCDIPAKIGKSVKFHADPLRRPSGPFIKNFLIEGDGGFALRCIQAFPVLETGRHDL